MALEPHQKINVSHCLTKTVLAQPRASFSTGQLVTSICYLQKYAFSEKNEDFCDDGQKNMLSVLTKF